METVLPLFIWVGIFAALFAYVDYLNKQRYNTGTLQAKSGTYYTYVIGDRLHWLHARTI